MLGLRSRHRPHGHSDLSSRQLPASRQLFPLDTPLLALSKQDVCTLGDACEGTQIMGGTGSGKSSGSGQALAKWMLFAGFGGLVLCAKPGEAATWARYAHETRRTASLVRFGADSGRHFNFLDYEMRRMRHLDANNLVSLLMRIMEGAKGGESKEGDAFWRDACEQLLKNAFLALHGAWGRITLSQLMQFIRTAPRKEKQLEDREWLLRSFYVTTLRKLRDQPENRLPPADQADVLSYFQDDWPNLTDRTRSGIEMHVSSIVSPLLTGYMREMFATSTDVIPEMTHEGAVIIVDLPIKQFDQAGILAAHIWKYLWQRAAERRKDTSSNSTRPVFLWADECQFFMSKYDMEFQSTARSSKACTVYLTQNLPTYFERMRGANPEHATHALLGNFQTKIFHQNLDPDTNRYAADLVGKRWLTVRSTGRNAGRNVGSSESRSTNSGSSNNSSVTMTGQTTVGGGNSWGRGKSRSQSEGTSYGSSESYAQQVEHELLPSAFAALRKGGGGQAPEAIVIQGGRVFRHSGRPYLTCTFPQR